MICAMNTPERADLKIFNDFVVQINDVVDLSNEKPIQVPFAVKRLSREIEVNRADLGEYFYLILKGMIAGCENKLSDVHHYFLSAIEFKFSVEVYIHYIKALLQSFENKEAYDLACSVYGMDSMHPEIYSLIGESACKLGLLTTALKWLEIYEKSTKSTHPFGQTLKDTVQNMPDIDENALSNYISSAVQFMKSRSVIPVSQNFNSINGEVLEVCFETNFNAEESSQFFYDFIASDYILNIPDEVLSNVTINFPPYVR